MTETERILTELAQIIIVNNARHLNQSIEDFNNILSRDPETALQNLSMLSKEDQQTPPAIIEKMIEVAGWKLPDGTLDKEDIYLDPCCGRGGILAYLHKHCGIPKENLYGIDIKKENVTLCNKLGFNVILGDALEDTSYVNINNKVVEIKGANMSINRVLMNPPFDKSLHLQILDTVIKNCCTMNSDCRVANISPANWLIDIKNTSRIKFEDIYSSISKQPVFIDGIAAGKGFKISLPDGLAITTYTSESIKTGREYNIIPEIVFSILEKIIKKHLPTLKSLAEQDKIDGWRVEIKPQLPTGVDLSHLYTNSEFHKQRGGKICPDISVFHNGLYKDGSKWFDTREKGKTYKGDEPLPCSIGFSDEASANNFHDSCLTNFYKNLVFMIRLNVSPRLELLPYMEDYSHVWTDQDYCNFFGLDKEESEFMCRKVDDYRVKDFINYIDLKDED